MNERSRRRSSDSNKTKDQNFDINKKEDENLPSTEDIVSKTMETETLETETKVPEVVNPDDCMGLVEKQLATNPKEFNASVSDASPRKQDTLSKETANKIIKTFAEKSNTSIQNAAIGIASLVQAGGTNASIPSITKVVNGQRFELKTLRDCVAFVTEKKGTVRQLAKTMRNVIFQIASQNGWQGPLATALKKEYPEVGFTPYELVTAGEFHDDNMEPYMSAKVREALVDRAKKKEAAQQKSKAKQPKRKGKKKR